MNAPLIACLAALMPVSLHAAPPPPPPPGTIIHHSPAASGLYIGSPSIVILEDGSYLASHDLFGPSSREHERAIGRLYRSQDRGASWQHLVDFTGFFWQGLFTHDGAAYLLGTDKHHGNLVIRRSTDGGVSWTEQSIIAEGEWHTAPMPVILHKGRLWRAVEDAHTSSKWGERYRARMLSAPVDADLLDAQSWTISEALARDPAWLEGDFGAWLEGNAVVDPEGNLVNILRVDTVKLPEKAAIIRTSADGKSARFDPASGFIDFPGGAKKFTIRKDPEGPGYWTLASIVTDRHAGEGKPAGIRNTLALLHSQNLLAWEIRSLLLYHPDAGKHGFQYLDWQFDGEDLIAASRTAWDDAEGGARNNHDANFLTFHRWEGFRNRSRADDVPLPEFIPILRETTEVAISGESYQLAKLHDHSQAFSNRDYRWHEVPESMAGKSFTRLNGGGKAVLEVTAKKDTTLRIATATDQQAIDLNGWLPTNESFHYDDPGRTRVHLFTRRLSEGQTLRLPSGNWTGAMLIID
jgi:hypothetical protein